MKLLLDTHAFLWFIMGDRRVAFTHLHDGQLRAILGGNAPRPWQRLSDHARSTIG